MHGLLVRSWFLLKGRSGIFGNIILTATCHDESWKHNVYTARRQNWIVIFPFISSRLDWALCEDRYILQRKQMPSYVFLVQSRHHVDTLFMTIKHSLHKKYAAETDCQGHTAYAMQLETWTSTLSTLRPMGMLQRIVQQAVLNTLENCEDFDEVEKEELIEKCVMATAK